MSRIIGDDVLLHASFLYKCSTWLSEYIIQNPPYLSSKGPDNPDHPSGGVK